MRVAYVNERSTGPNPLNIGVRQKFQRIPKRIVPSHKDAATNRSCHHADIIKGNIALIDQAKSGLGLVGGSEKQPEKLLLRIPVAAEVIDELKPLLLNLSGQIVQVRKQIPAGRTFGLEFTFEGHPQRPDLGQNLKPRQEDPEGCNRETDSPVPRRQIPEQKRYRQNAEDTESLSNRMVKRPKCHAQDSDP